MSKRRSKEEISLNVTAMLDMAFQLLAFFVLTFKPPPGEDQIFLKLPPAKPVLMPGTQEAGKDPNKKEADVKPTTTLEVRLLDAGTGSLSDIQVGIPGTNLPPKSVAYNELERELRTYFRAKDEHDTPDQKGNVQGSYEQVVINASPTLHWEEIMKIVDLCTMFKTGSGNLPAVSLVQSGPEVE
jgi:biopolymer transport protein ExbD